MAKLNTGSEQSKTSGDLRTDNTMMQMLEFVERYERLQEEKDSLSDDQKEIMAEAKGIGFDTAILRQVIRRRKVGSADLMEHDALLELYEDTIKRAMKKQVKDSEAEAGAPVTRNVKIDAAKKAPSPPPAQMDVEEIAPAVPASVAPVAEALVTEPAWPDDQQAAEVTLEPEEPAPVPVSELPDPPAFLRRART